MVSSARNAHWVDKEIRKLIVAMKELGGGGPRVEVTYGRLFSHTENSMEALSGTLKTARRQGVVSYEGEALFQGSHDHVVVTLLKEDIPDSDETTYTYQQVRQCSFSRRNKPSESLRDTQSNCYSCQKVVYPAEYVGAAGKAFHRQCFRCETCRGQLRADTFATVDGRFFCRPHYEQAYKKGGNYTTGFAAAGSSHA